MAPAETATERGLRLVAALVFERDRCRAALVEIADGGCTNSWSPPCPPEDRCDPCTARAALDATGGPG